MLLDHRIQLFHDHKLLHHRSKVQDQLLGKRVDHAKLQDAGLIAKHLFHILIAGGRSDDSKLSITHLYSVQVRRLRELDQLAGSFLHKGMTADRISRHHHILRNVLLIGLLLGKDALLLLHNALRMRHAGAHLHNNGRVKLLGNLICLLYEIPRLRGICGLKHRNLRRHGIMSGILLILRGVHSGVVCNANDQTGIHASIRTSKEWISRHIKSHVLHAAKASLSGKACAKSHFHGNLLIRCPLTINLIILCSLFRHLGTRRPWITRNHAAACLVKATGKGLIS